MSSIKRDSAELTCVYHITSMKTEYFYLFLNRDNKRQLCSKIYNNVTILRF